MRHLHFTQSLEPLQGGGLGSSTIALHRELLALGMKSTVCSTYAEVPQRLADKTCEFRRLKPGVLFYAPELRKRSRELVADADVLHGHGLYVGTNYVLGREALRQGKPLVYHIHGFFEPWILSRSRWKKRLAHWLFEDANFRHARLWRALTTREADQIRAFGIKGPIVVAPNGLNSKDYPRSENADEPVETPLIPFLTKARRRLLFLGRIHPKKGLNLLLPAWASLGPVRQNWEFVVAGPDEQGYLNEVRGLAGALDLHSEVRFTGPVTGRVKNALLYSADLFVLPSYSEGFAMSLLEAMACEVPVVATRACNFPDITASQAGWECECTTDSVAEILTHALLESDSARKQRGQNGRRLVRERYSWPVILKTLMQACTAHCS